MYYIRKYQTYILWITIFVFAIIFGSTQAEIKQNNVTITRTPVQENHCECILHNCGCCDHIEIDPISINGTLCSNVSYLDHDYGFSVTVTYNNIPIINETLSARNPPPICFGENFIENFPLACCFRLYDIDINTTTFHCCFELEARIAKLNILPLHLGCINSNHSSSSNILSLSHINIYFSIFLILMSHILIN